MSNFESNDAISQTKVTEQQLAILSLLPRAVSTIHNIDELFQWLAAQLLQRFQLQVAEIWSLQPDPGGQYTPALRSLAIRDHSLPQHVVTNNHIAEFATHLFSEQRNYPLQSINGLFSHYPASLLSRYGLSYITSHYFHSPMTLLPLAHQANGVVPFTLVILLFQHDRPLHDPLAALQALLPQVVQAAKTQGLLSRESVTPYPPTTGSPYTPIPQQSLSLWHLIPHRSREGGLLMSSNPLSRSVDIPDKQARRLYSAIDGHKSLADLSRATGMEARELLRALQNLIAQRRIELREPGGKLINPAHFLP